MRLRGPKPDRLNDLYDQNIRDFDAEQALPRRLAYAGVLLIFCAAALFYAGAL